MVVFSIMHSPKCIIKYNVMSKTQLTLKYVGCIMQSKGTPYYEGNVAWVHLAYWMLFLQHVDQHVTRGWQRVLVIASPNLLYSPWWTPPHASPITCDTRLPTGLWLPPHTVSLSSIMHSPSCITYPMWHEASNGFSTMNGGNRPLVTNEVVKFDK